MFRLNGVVETIGSPALPGVLIDDVGDVGRADACMRQLCPGISIEQAVGRLQELFWTSACNL